MFNLNFRLLKFVRLTAIFKMTPDIKPRFRQPHHWSYSFILHNDRADQTQVA